MSSRITLRQLCNYHPQGLTIASYQRHYVWGRYREGKLDVVSNLTDCLVNAFLNAERYFLQGITVHGDSLVDGQQRLTYLHLLLRILGGDIMPKLCYQSRPQAQAWLDNANIDDAADAEKSQDIYYFLRTISTIRQRLSMHNIDASAFAEYVLDGVDVLYIPLPEDADEIAIYRLSNGTKLAMQPVDIIKAVIMYLASDPDQPKADLWQLGTMRTRYAREWNAWSNWWHTQPVSQYYAPIGYSGLDLLIKLCIRTEDADPSTPLTYEELYHYLKAQDQESYIAAKYIFDSLRRVQRRFEDAFADAAIYNRIGAILLLQPRREIYRFLHLYFVQSVIDADELQRYYRLSFLGMSISEIAAHVSEADRFDDLLTSLSMADVYHSDTKRDVFSLLLRLNIDEDIKLDRKFDFSVWDNRSLEHIYSKSKVWHTDADGHVLDGNDNTIHTSRHAISQDPTFMPRHKIVNHDGTQLSEHCIGNLVLLYGQNNAVFGNATFDRKKVMFLSPGDQTVFRSRNLLHTVCVFAGNTWDHRSIVDNYNKMLKNLKIYYGFK